MSKDEPAVKDEQVATPEPTPTAPAPVENKDPEPAAEDVEKELEDSELSFEGDDDGFSDDDDETEGKEPDPKADPAKPTEETKPDSQPKGKAEERKQQLKDEIEDLSKATGVDTNAEIRDLVAQRNALRELNETRQREAQLASERGLLQEVNPETGEYYSPAEAERIARQQTLETAQATAAEERYAMEVQQNQTLISTEARRALHDFPMFDAMPDENGKPTNPEYDEELTKQADELLNQSLIRDQNGVLVGSNVSPYKLYKTFADSTRASAAKAQAKAQKATETMLANVDDPVGASQANSKPSDPDLDAFDEEAARP
jgi:hypothetical protein